MVGSTIVYSGLIVAVAGLVLVVRPIRRLRVTTRWRAAGVAAAGVVLAALGLILPASESRVMRMETRLDEFMPVWQFREHHTIAVDAPPARVFEAIERLRADEIFLFRTLIRIRYAGGQPPIPENLPKAGERESLMDFATRTTFVRLARDAPRELVVGTVVGRPPGRPRARPTPQLFQQRLPDGFALATMNYMVTEAGPGRSLVSTETRVFANSPAARRRFAAYWRIIYPGSALIRRMALRAIRRRATSPSEAVAAAAIVGASVEQTSHGSRPALMVRESFDGLGAGMAAGPGTNNPPVPRNPSDNSLAVGPNHIFQIVNAQLAIFTKKGAQYDATGRTLYGPVSTNTIFAGFSGVCEARPNGDAVVRYDQIAGRWLVVMPIFRRTAFDPDRSGPGQPAKPGEAARPGAAGRPGPPPPLPAVQPGPAAPPQPSAGTYAMCYAVSVGEDPLGPYYRYAFERPLFPDYPRPAIWPDGYYVPTSTGDEVIQKHACVVERAKMLRGQPAREQCIVIDGVNFLNNADVDGRGLPPAGAPNVMMAAGGTQLQKILGDDGILVWKFHVDWKNPARTTVTGPEKIAVAPYRYLCGGQLTNCVTQPDTDRRLDAQGDKIMQRLIYRNAGSHESIVAVHSVDTEAGRGGVRWYELRIDSHRDVHLYQQGTYAPDRFYRWMASPAMDRLGNIAIGYSFGGAPNYPGQRLAARLATDPPGVLTFRETVLVEGQASQTVMRWEDYSQTAMDPVDDCTIWYVGDYVKKAASTYSTRIGSVRLPGCPK